MKAAQVAKGFGIIFLVVKIIYGIAAYFLIKSLFASAEMDYYSKKVSQALSLGFLVGLVVAGLIDLLLVFGASLKNKWMIIAWLVFAYFSQLLIGVGILMAIEDVVSEKAKNDRINQSSLSSMEAFFLISEFVGFAFGVVIIYVAHKTIGEINEERTNVENRIPGD